MALTKRKADAASYPYDPESKRRHVVWEDKVPSFGLGVFPSGRKSYVFRFQLGGRQRWMTLGDHGPMTVQQARSRAMKARVGVSDGTRPGRPITPATTAGADAEGICRAVYGGDMPDPQAFDCPKLRTLPPSACPTGIWEAPVKGHHGRARPALVPRHAEGALRPIDAFGCSQSCSRKRNGAVCGKRRTRSSYQALPGPCTGALLVHG